MLMALKQGGIASFTSRIEYLTTYGYQEGMDKLVAAGKWKFLHKEEYTKYNKLNAEDCGRFKATQSMVFCFKKL